MSFAIYNPLEDYEKRLKDEHEKNTTSFFEELLLKSGVNVEENRKTVARYTECDKNAAKIKKKLNRLCVFRVLMCITVVLIPLVILKTTPKIRRLREELKQVEEKTAELLAEAYKQTEPLNALFTDRDSLNLICQTLPPIDFDEHFSSENESDMEENYDFLRNNEETTVEALYGKYNENPFLFESKLVHSMGTEIYHGYKTISWTEFYTDSKGKTQRRTRTQTLHATLEKPKPYYENQVVLNYGSQSGSRLSFSRTATHLEQKNEKEIQKYVKRGEKKLKKLTDKALEQGGNFTGMSNSDFEVLFGALDRNDEVGFRTLFTPLAQTNMVDLILAKNGCGDDFDFIKRNRMNKIVSAHSRGRELILRSKEYRSYSVDIIKENFINKNKEFFKAVYFDFAPILAIPSYTERPVQSLKPIAACTRRYSSREYESLANAVDAKYVVHNDTKTAAVLKSKFLSSENDADKMHITAYSYNIEERVSLVSVFGGDGKYHDVPVTWDEYLPLERETDFFVSSAKASTNKNVLATKNDLCIFN